MSLTTEFAPIAIAQVKAAYDCSELDAITRLQGAAAADGDERSLEVLCAIKGKLIEAANPVTTAAKAAALAARIVRFCQEHALGLDGMVADLDAGLPLDAELAKRLTTYCDQVQCLTLGGLIDEVWELRNEYHAAPNQVAPAAPVMNAFRNLYKIRNEKRDVVAFVTSRNADGARGKYHGAGGQVEVVTAEQVSTGYEQDVCTIYA